MLVARLIFDGDVDAGWWVAASAFAVVVGHVFPLWLGFRGGKGVATGLGAFVVLAPLALLCALPVFVFVVWATRYVSLGSIMGAAALPMFMMYFQPYRSAIFIGGTIFISLLCILKHHANIARLKSGTENRLGSKKPAPEPTA